MQGPGWSGFLPTAGRPQLRMGRKPATWIRIDRDYGTLPINMQTLFHNLGITRGAAAAQATFCRSESRKCLNSDESSGVSSFLWLLDRLPILG